MFQSQQQAPKNFTIASMQQQQTKVIEAASPVGKKTPMKTGSNTANSSNSKHNSRQILNSTVDDTTTATNLNEQTDI